MMSAAIQHASTLVEARPVRSTRSGSRSVEIGSRIGPYRVSGFLGRGGFGTIWYAVHTATRREVAIKVLRQEYITTPDVLARFKREAEVIAMLEHPNIVELREFGELPSGQPYLVMEFLAGQSLAQHLQRRGAWNPADLLDLLEPLCDALSVAHRHGIVHRDIKTSNVMLCETEDRPRVVLLDFGIAKLLEGNGPQLTAPCSTIGSPFFMAPEQIRGRSVDGRTDIYALGILVFELLTGKLPFSDDLVLYRHLSDARPAPSRHGASTAVFDQFVKRAMAVEPGDRHASVEEFLAAARECVRRHRGVTSPSAPSEQAIGVFLEARTDSHTDQALDDVDAVMQTAERFLSERGFTVAYTYGTTSLLIVPLASSPATATIQRRDALADVFALRGVLMRRTDPHPSVQVGIHLTTGEVERCADAITGELVDRPVYVAPGAISTSGEFASGMNAS